MDPLTRTPAEPYPTLLTRLQVREEVFYFSECTWVETWLRADRRRDDDTKAAATQALAALPAKLDVPVALSANQGIRDLQQSLADAAESDQRSVLQRELTLNCGDLR